MYNNWLKYGNKRYTFRISISFTFDYNFVNKYFILIVTCRLKSIFKDYSNKGIFIYDLILKQRL